ncbi:molecular chaperone GrpE [bacterium A37T11]|nr:molecular chaperone GrpE [bacterium A37T11]
MKEQNKKDKLTDNTDDFLEQMDHSEEGGDHLEEVSAQDEGGKDEANISAQLAEANDKYLRLYAEFDNYKRRTTKERLDLLQSAGKEVIADMLPVLDDFERALKALDNSPESDALKEGIKLVHQKLLKILTQKGLKEMASIGTIFNPDLQEAITNIPAPTDDLRGKVIDEVEKGYYLNDKVLRYAKVVVGN